MIASLRPTHKESIEKAEQIEQAKQTLQNAERQTLYDNLAYGIFFIIATSGALLLGKLISIIVKNAT
ncbi:hypothetical protein Pan153_61130 [Gimesia panareensis]|uniref:Uncharacterized protein n=1 Tax=Gimesia panareensis TaxID=2527978 RepID=A0A518FYJ7_9PLAN|nr:hypothetical protein [Gimesia panareensis]QDV21425.1 hypothetical protein Pan153_61130 [Gimesia panareensis]